MEKPPIYSSAPKPPKQIRVVENPVEPTIEKQDLPEIKEEKASTITVMHPNVSKNNTVVKLNPEKPEPLGLPNEEPAVSVENELPKNDEIINAPSQADLKTVTDFTDNKQIVTVEEPFEEPTLATDLNVDAKDEVVSTESEENVANEEPNATEIDAKIPAESDATKSEENIVGEIPETADVDAKKAAESSTETKDNEEAATVETPEITNVESKANEEPAIETKEKDDAPVAIGEEQEGIDVDVKSAEENISLITDEDIAASVPPTVEGEAGTESNTETIANVGADIVPETVTEPEVEFVTISEQYSQNEVAEEIKFITEPKAVVEKSTKSSGSSKNKVDAEYDFENLKIPGDDELFQRQYYTMGEVATMFHANQSQIRFWENEFDILQPKKNKKGDRYFRPEDVKNLQVIHHLLRNRRFTIEGAREYLKSNKQRAQETVSAIASLSQLKSFLTELKANL